MTVVKLPESRQKGFFREKSKLSQVRHCIWVRAGFGFTGRIDRTYVRQGSGLSLDSIGVYQDAWLTEILFVYNDRMICGCLYLFLVWQ